MIAGFKCFNKGLTNRYGKKFEVGLTYKVDGNIKFGNVGNGFHMCLNLEDTLRYFDAMNDEVDICEVYGFGNIDEYEDKYYEYYDLYACEYLYIYKVLTRDEIIRKMLEVNVERAKRFISLYKLTDEEKDLFKNKFNYADEICDMISYYQDNDKDVFKRKI